MIVIKYYVHLKQNGGCDYSIGCGEALLDLKAESLADAIEEAEEIIARDYNYDESKLYSAELLAVSQVVKIDVEAVYARCEDEEEAYLEAESKAARKRQYEELKREFEGQ